MGPGELDLQGLRGFGLHPGQTRGWQHRTDPPSSVFGAVCHIHTPNPCPQTSPQAGKETRKEGKHLSQWLEQSPPEHPPDAIPGWGGEAAPE